MRPIGKLFACLKINTMKKFTFCSLLDYLNGLDTTQKPVEIATETIRVVVVP
jgi:hypothetical protein